MPPISPWVIERGEVIPAGLPSQIVSDLPGDLVAEVKRDVYDTPTHRYVLIPAGSLLAGEYNSALSYGQKRVQEVWSYLRFPDGSYVDLDKFVGHGADGSTGLSDQVDNHIKRLIGGVALSSMFAAGLQISQNRTTGNSTLTYPSNAQLAASAVGQQAAELGQQITSRNLNVQPTVKIRPGEVFYVSVMKSIVFPGPYKPLEGR
jgi:type IV secretion system protein VirB10